MKRIEVVYGEGGRSYTYESIKESEVKVGDVVIVPPTFLGDTSATVVRLGSDYDGPCDRIIGVRP